MIEDKAGFAIANEIAEAIEIGNEHRTTVGHRFKRRDPKRFPALRQRRINKKPRVSKSFLKRKRLKDRSGERDSIGRSRSGTLQFRQKLSSTPAKSRFCGSDHHHFPILKSSARSANKRIDQKMHAFFRMHAADVKNDLVAIRDRWRRGGCRSGRGIWNDRNPFG